MLHELDRELERQGCRFVRYADDCVPWSCTRDGKAVYINSGLPKSMYRHWFQTTLSCIGKEPLWWALRKRSCKKDQVSIMEMSESEPLKKCRKRRNDVKTGR
jgi:hypothetical protein